MTCDLKKGHEFQDYQGAYCEAKLSPLYGSGDRVLYLGTVEGQPMLLEKDQARALALLLLTWATEDKLE